MHKKAWRQDLDVECMLQCSEFQGDDDDMTSTPCLIMQYKPYIVELPPTKEA